MLQSPQYGTKPQLARFVLLVVVKRTISSVFFGSLLSVQVRLIVLLVIVKHILGLINLINDVVLTYLIYLGCSLRHNSV